MIQIKVTKQVAEVVATEPIVSGSVNAYQLVFWFDSAWDGLYPTAVFKAGDSQISVILTGDTCILPWEVLSAENTGYPLYVGVYGIQGTETVIPTLWAKLGTIQEGTELGDNTRPPSPDAYQQYVAAVVGDSKVARESAEGAARSAEAAANDSQAAGAAAQVSQEAARRSENARDIAVEAEGNAARSAGEAGQYAATAETGATVATNAKEETLVSAREAATAAGSAIREATQAATSSTVALSAQRGAEKSENNAKASETAAVQAARESVAVWNQIKNKTVVTVERTYPTAPQIDFTVEEATPALAFTEVEGVPMQDYNFTEMRFYCENLPQSSADTSELRVALNRSATGMYTAATDFLVATRQLYTGGGVSLKDGLAWATAPQTNKAWRGSLISQVYPYLEYGRVVRSVNFWSNNTPIPVGTKIQVWLR